MLVGKKGDNMYHELNSKLYIYLIAWDIGQ